MYVLETFRFHVFHNHFFGGKDAIFVVNRVPVFLGFGGVGNVVVITAKDQRSQLTAPGTNGQTG